MMNQTHCVKERPHVLQEGKNYIQQYIERNTTFEIHKAIALQVFSASVTNGSGILEACNFASQCTQFSACTIRTWAVEVFRDYFGVVSNIDDVTDERLPLELL